MPTFVSLMKLTDQGVKDIKGASKRLDEEMECIARAGGR